MDKQDFFAMFGCESCNVDKFFDSNSVCQRLNSHNKIIGGLKNERCKFFLCFYGLNQGSFAMFRGAGRSANF